MLDVWESEEIDLKDGNQLNKGKELGLSRWFVREIVNAVLMKDAAVSLVERPRCKFSESTRRDWINSMLN